MVDFLKDASLLKLPVDDVYMPGVRLLSWIYDSFRYSLPRQRSRVWNRPRLCVCLLLSAPPAEPFDIRTQNLVERLRLTTSRTSSKVKVIGQGHQVEMRFFFIKLPLLVIISCCNVWKVSVRRSVGQEY